MQHVEYRIFQMFSAINDTRIQHWKYKQASISVEDEWTKENNPVQLTISIEVFALPD